MARQHFRLVTSDVFPDNPFFTHLQKGTAFFRQNNAERAIEEWAAARRVEYAEPIPLKRVEGKIACGIRLDQTQLLFFLHAIHLNGASGVGVVRADQKALKLIFRKGNPTALGISPSTQQLKKILRQKGMKSEEDFHSLEEIARKEGKDLGSYLVEKEKLPLHTLKELMTRLLVHRFGEMVFRTSGTFVFMEKSVPAKPLVEFSPVELAETVARSAFGYTAFQNAVPNLKTIFRHSPYLGDDKKQVVGKLDIDAQYLFSLIDGARNVEQLKRFSGTGENAILKKLYELNTMGLIRRTREVMEYEDKEFAEITKSIAVLFDVYRLITHDLFHELGLRGKEAIKDARQILHPDHQKIFNGMELTEPEKLATDDIIRNLARNFPQADQRMIFIDAFSELYFNILDELIKFLGIGLTNETAKEIRHKISDIERFASDSEMKKRLLKVLSRLTEKL